MSALPLPLSDTDFDRIETLLDDPALSDAMRLDEIQGYLCAALTGPLPPAFAEQLAEILGEESDQESPAALELGPLLERFAGELGERLASDEPLTLLLYGTDEDPEGPSDYEPWCMAYLHGLDSADENWFDALTLDEEIEFLDECLFPFMVLTGEAEEAAHEHGEDWPTGNEKDTLIAECQEELPRALSDIHRFWLAHRGSTTIRRDSPKAGRNDPCPCGSGRKYKQCCGTH